MDKKWRSPGGLESITATELTLVLKDNDTSLIEHLIDFVGICLRNGGLCTEGGESLMCLALEEALQNAFLHGNLEIGSALRDSSGDQEFAELVETRRTSSPYRDRRVSATISVSPRAAKFVVRDEGPRFDPSQVPGSHGSGTSGKAVRSRSAPDAIVYGRGDV